MDHGILLNRRDVHDRVLFTMGSIRHTSCITTIGVPRLEIMGEVTWSFVGHECPTYIKNYSTTFTATGTSVDAIRPLKSPVARITIFAKSPTMASAAAVIVSVPSA